MTLGRIEKIVASDPGHGRAIGIGACRLAQLRENERAREWVTRARLVDPDNVNLHYNLACAMATIGEVDLALETLAGVALKISPGMMSWLEADTDLDSLREEPGFKAMIGEVKARLATA